MTMLDQYLGGLSAMQITGWALAYVAVALCVAMFLNDGSGN